MARIPELPSEEQTLSHARTLREIRLGRRRLAKDSHYQELKQQLNNTDTPEAQRDTIATEMREIHDAAMMVPSRSPRAPKPRHEIGK